MKALTSPHKAMRFEYIDAIRGFAIVLVVLGHALQYGSIDPDGNPVLVDQHR